MPISFRPATRPALARRTHTLLSLLAVLALAPLPKVVSAREVIQAADRAVPAPEALPATGKLTPDLLSLVGSLRSLSPAERARLSSLRADHLGVPVFRTVGPDAAWLQVYVQVKDTTRKTIDALLSEGMLPEYALDDQAIVQGYVPLDAVECLAELPCVRRVSRPVYSICNAAQGSPSQGAYVTRGDELMETDFMRSSAGLDGTDSTVGVLSVGLFNSDYPAPTDAASADNDYRVYFQDFPRVNPFTSPGRRENLGGIRIFPSSDYTRHYVTRPIDLLALPLDLTHVSFDPPILVDYYQQRPPIWQLVATDGEQVIRPAGALMLEVVHDIAPNARLLFGSSRTDVEFYLNRERMVDEILADGRPDVIVDDVAFPGLGRYDGTSSLSRRATELVRYFDIVYVTAVGDYTAPTGEITQTSASANGKPLFVNAFFNPDSTNGNQKFHGFNDPTDNYRDETLEIGIDPELGFFEAYLVWDDVWVNALYDTVGPDDEYHAKYQPAGRATDDLDLFIVNSDTLDTARPIAFSNFRQDGRSENPVERIVTTSSDRISLMIRRKNALDNRPTFFTLVITAGVVYEPRYLTHGVPMCNSDALGGVISVGSIDLRAPSVDQVTNDTIPGLNPGPGAERFGRFLQWRPGAQKPDLCGYEDVITLTGHDSSTLFLEGTAELNPNALLRYYARGSSIAAAHVAGFCAVLRQFRSDLHALQYHGLLTNTQPPAGDNDPLHANAVKISTEVAQFGNAPVYRRLEAGNVYRNLLRSPNVIGPTNEVTTTQDFVDGPGLWSHGPLAGSPFALPEFEARDGMLVIRATQLNTFGYWESPILTFVDPDDGAPSSALSPDHLYRLTVRVSCSQPDPNKIPDFRIRMITSSADEVAELVVNSVTLDGANAPRDGQPRDYTLFYQPTPEAALYGLRVAVDMVHFNARDDSSAELYIHQVNFEQLEVPVAPSSAP